MFYLLLSSGYKLLWCEVSKQCCVNQSVAKRILCVILAELGDYEEGIHSPGVVSEFRFVENQTEEMELAILEKFKGLAK